MKRKVINKKNLPTRFPVISYLNIIFWIYYFDLPGWLNGVLITFLVLVAIGFFINIFEEKQVDVFDEDLTKTKENFQQKINEKN